MPKVKIPRKSTRQDMTAMCDVGFLLLTFFMLTSTFLQKEPVQVNTPSSISEIKIPETNIMMILVENNGKVFWGVDRQEDRVEILKKMGELYNISFTNEELLKFSVINRSGVPIEALKQYLALNPDYRDRPENNPGIPCDSTDNQFKNWVRFGKIVNKDLLIAIKADKVTPYPSIKKVMNSLQDIKENKYNLITSLEEGVDFRQL
jgi:biopolymer transport protein ExbD